MFPALEDGFQGSPDAAVFKLMGGRSWFKSWGCHGQRFPRGHDGNQLLSECRLASHYLTA